ncbi:diguanylate cyclase (GGDEF)-like protein/PAS domain S-box-containing protein [Bacillus ectoiniformans]|uniref:diguanylate cyclase domain-containing protein n=1 Tax=Bacillus ectoiniformans TaxID=1494429 RepID=UPI001956856A|nr:diguanylate cyclase [Bacillus ectoiniformans]MBM7649273.1 diguanylate cyclase (GGDEF)-like protein/PAS domain S-box-containing protein [Bacillus ectoiniformans]
MNPTKWRRLLRLTTLKRQLSFWMVSLFLATGAVIITALIIVSDYGRREEVVQQLSETMKTQQYFIDNWLEKRMEAVEYLAALPAVRLKDYNQLEDAMQTFANSQSEFDAIVFMNDQGVTEIDTKRLPGIDLSDRDYFKAAKQGESMITDIFVARATNAPLFILSVPAYDLQGKFYGVLFGAITLETINGLVNGLSFGKTGETYLINKDGTMLTRPTHYEAATPEEFYRNPPHLTTHIYDRIIKKEDPIYRRAYTNYQSETVLGSYHKIIQKDWYIIGEIKKEEVLLPFWRMVSAVVGALIVALLIFYGILMLMFREIYLPLAHLLNGTKRMADGQFNYRVEDAIIEGSASEFQELCHSYNQMATTIEQYTNKIEESENRYKVLVESAPEAIGVHKNDRVIFINEQTIQMLGAETSADIVGRYIQEFIHPESVEKFKETRAQYQNYKLDVKLCRVDDTVIEAEVSVAQIIYEGEAATQFIIRNVTEQRRMQEELRQSRERYLAVINQTKEVIFQLDLTGKFMFMNYYWSDLTGYKVEESLGCSVFDYLAKESQAKAKQTFHQLVSHKKDECREEFQIVTESGEVKWIEVTASLRFNSEGEVEGVAGVMYDMTVRKEAEQQLKKANEILSNLSMIDGLTEIPNRRTFDLRLKEEWSRSARTSQPVSLIMLDIDHFKIYNDTYGHQGGDQCLKQIAKEIQSTLKRPGDIAARYGGEEFAVILPNTAEEGACLVAEAIRTNIVKLAIPHIHSKVKPYVTISAGVTTLMPTPYLSVNDLVRLADKALYHSKESGRNQWHFKGRENERE